jgi:proteasome lid subunit RPN8/RPN11
VIVPAELRERLVAQSHKAAPAEACGWVVVDVHTDRVIAFVACANVAEEPGWSFELSPRDLALAAQLAANEGAEVVVFHSHVDEPATPSVWDRRFSRAGDRLLIYSVRLDELRLFRLVPPDRFTMGRLRAVEEPVCVVTLPNVAAPA